MDIIVNLKYSNGEYREFIEPITESLSFKNIDKYLKKKYYDAISIEWDKKDTLTEDY